MPDAVVAAIGATFACDDALARPLHLLLREVRPPFDQPASCWCIFVLLPVH